MPIIEQHILETVEVGSIRVAAKMDGSGYWSESTSNKSFSIYAHADRESGESLDICRLKNSRLVVGYATPIWKIVTAQNIYIEESGFTEQNGKLNIIENWPQIEGRWVIRSQYPTIDLDFGERTPVVIGGDTAHYHMILNWFPRMMVYRKFKERLGEHKPIFLVHSQMDYKYDYLFNYLGIDSADIFRIPEGGNIFLRDCILPKFFSNALISRNVLDFYRETFVEKLPEAGKKRIYISRMDSALDSVPRRKVINETEVRSLLEKYDFQLVCLAGLPVRDQVEIFNNASFVLAPHGAALANCVFCEPGTKAIVLENEWDHEFMKELLEVAGCITRKLKCTDVVNVDYEAAFLGSSDHQEIIRNRNMLVDIELLETAIVDLLNS